MKKSDREALKERYEGKVFRSEYDGTVRWVTHISISGNLTALRLDEEEHVWRYGGIWRPAEWKRYALGLEVPELRPTDEYILVGVLGHRNTVKVETGTS
jgi:hypothetical protein